jgi:HEAT repeat protein
MPFQKFLNYAFSFLEEWLSMTISSIRGRGFILLILCGMGGNLLSCASSEYDLLYQAKSKNALERQKALVKLSEREDTRYIPLFVAALSPDQPTLVRTTAVSALGKYRESEIVEPIILTLEDPSHFVRLHAAEALQHFPEAPVVEALSSRFKIERHIWVKQKIIESLRVIGIANSALKKICIEPLIEGISDSQEGVAKNAQLALRSMTGQSYGKNIDQWNRWWTQYKLTHP